MEPLTELTQGPTADQFTELAIAVRTFTDRLLMVALGPKATARKRPRRIAKKFAQRDGRRRHPMQFVRHVDQEERRDGE